MPVECSKQVSKKPPTPPVDGDLNVCSECGHLNRYREIQGELILEKVGPREENTIRKQFPNLAALLDSVGQAVREGSL